MMHITEPDQSSCSERAGGDDPVDASSPVRRRHVGTLSVLPTLATLLNMLCGVIAIYYATQPLAMSGPWDWSTLTTACVLVFLGMFFDVIDGALARMTGTQSKVGAELDSLSDIVTFGLAPVFIMLNLIFQYPFAGEEALSGIPGPEHDHYFVKLIWGISAIYVCCTALRLARFNVEVPPAAVASFESHQVFRGMPSPSAAGLITSLVLLHQHYLAHLSITYEWSFLISLIMSVVTLLCAFGMVSNIPFTHFINRYVSGKRSFTYVARLMILLFFGIRFFHETLVICFLLYALHGPLAMYIQSRWKGREPIPEPH